jgi:hypothetical protein
VSHKEGGKKFRYKSLYVEIKGTWNMNCMIIPAIIGATGIATEGFKDECGSHTKKIFNIFTTKDQLYLELLT